MPIINCDILIIGAGHVGVSMALALKDFAGKICLIDKNPSPKPSKRARAIALAEPSLSWLTSMNCPIAKNCQAEIKSIHVSEQGSFGHLVLDSSKLATHKLAQVVDSQALLIELYQQLRKQNHCKIFDEVQITKITVEALGNQTQLVFGEKEYQVNSKLIIAADGNRSVFCQNLSIPMQKQNPKQMALVGNLQLGMNHQNRAYERFFTDGAAALLPFGPKQVKSVLMLPIEQAEALNNLGESAKLKRLQGIFGFYLGRFQGISDCGLYALEQSEALITYAKGWVLLGNAAHTLHPFGAQGLNLSLRDVACLAEILIQAKSNNEDLADLKHLQTYQHLRSSDQALTKYWTHEVRQLFLNSKLSRQLLRQLGLVSWQMLPSLKQKLVRLGLGATSLTLRD